MKTNGLRLGWVMVLAAAASCSPASPPGDRVDAAPPTTASGDSNAAAALARPPALEVVDSGDSLARVRDPFVPGVEPVVDPRRDHHLLDDRAVDELRLLGTVTGSRTPQAMVADPSGRGWVVEPGMRIGRVEIHGSSVAFWRVDRIRAGDVVLVRDDGGEAGRPAATRVLSLRRPG